MVARLGGQCEGVTLKGRLCKRPATVVYGLRGGGEAGYCTLKLAGLVTCGSVGWAAVFWLLVFPVPVPYVY